MWRAWFSIWVRTNSPETRENAHYYNKFCIIFLYTLGILILDYWSTAVHIQNIKYSSHGLNSNQNPFENRTQWSRFKVMPQVSPELTLIILVNERNKLFNSSSTISLFIREQDWVMTGFQIEVLTLVQHITENRLRHARGPVHTIGVL